MKILDKKIENKLDDIDKITLKQLEEEFEPLIKPLKWMFMVLIFSFIIVPVCVGLITHSIVIGVVSIFLSIFITRLILMQDMETMLYLQVELPKFQAKLEEFNNYVNNKYVNKKEN